MDSPEIQGGHELQDTGLSEEAVYYKMQAFENETFEPDVGTELDMKTTATQADRYEAEQLRVDRQSDTARINNMSDNFFSFTITLLAQPEISNLASLLSIYELTLKHAAAETLIHLVMLVHWTANVQLMAMMEATDSTIATLNMLSMFFVSIVPFTVTLVYDWPAEFYTALIINANLVIISIFTLLIWLYASYKKQFLYRTVSYLTTRKFTVRFCVPIVIYSLSIAVAPISNLFSLFVSCIVPMWYIVSMFGFDCFNRLYDLIAFIVRKIRRKEKRPSFVHLIGEEYTTSDLYHSRVIERVKAISDNVFGITITLMVIKLVAPQRPTITQSLSAAVQSMGTFMHSIHAKNVTTLAPSPATNHTYISEWEWNNILGQQLTAHSYTTIWLYNFLAFVIIGTCWKAHTYLTRGMRRVDLLFMGANMAYLSLSTFIPFTAQLLGSRGDIVYNGLLFNCMCFSLSVILLATHYIAARRQLKDEEFKKKKNKVLFFYKYIAEAVIYFISVMFLAVNVPTAIAIAMLVPFFEFMNAFHLDFYRITWLVLYKAIGFTKDIKYPVE